MGITLKDWYGKDQTFDHDTFFVRDENGENVQFSKGTGEPTLETLEVTENGTYTPSEGVDGFSSVEVNVEGAGGGSLSAGGYLTGDTIPSPYLSYPHRLFKLNGNLYALVWPYRLEQTTKVCGVYKYIDGEWTRFDTDGYTIEISSGIVDMECIEFNGKMHIIGGSYNYHYVFDEANGLIILSHLPNSVSLAQVFIDDGKLKAYATIKPVVWDESTDTWTDDTSAPSWRGGVNYKGALYWWTVNDEIYIRENGVDTKLCQNGDIFLQMCVKNGYLYDYYPDGNFFDLYKTNLETGERTFVIRVGKVEKVMFYTIGDDEPILWRGCHNRNYNTATCFYVLHEVTE